MNHTTRSLWLLMVCLSLMPGLAARAWPDAKPAQKSPLPAAGKTSAPKPATAAPTASRPLPDLAVERIWLDGECRINVQLKNAGPGAIPDAEHNRAQLKLFIGETEAIFPLGKGTGASLSADPRGVLKKAGGVASFNSGQRLQAKGLVRVVLDSDGHVKELKTANNRSQATLTPSCGTARLPAAAGARVAAGPIPEPVPLILTTGRDDQGTASVNETGMHDLRPDYRLHVDVDPALGTRVLHGDSVSFSFSIDKSRMAVFDGLTLTLRPGVGPGSTGREAVVELIPESAGYSDTWLANYRWTVADTIPIGRYYLSAVAQLEANGYRHSWESPQFYVNARTALPPVADRIVLRIDHPSAGETINSTDHTIQVGYYCNVGDAPRPDFPEVAFRFKLLKHDRVVRRYVINFFGRSDFLHSQSFSTEGFRTASDYEIQIDVFDPSTDEVYKTASSGLFTIDMTYER